MIKLATLGCLAALAMAGGTGAAQACSDDRTEYRAKRAHGYSYAPRTYGYTSRRWAYGYGPAYDYDDDGDFSYGYGPSAGVEVGVYGDFDRRGRRFRNRDGSGDRADRGERRDRFTQRGDGVRNVMDRGEPRNAGANLRSDGGGTAGSAAGGPRSSGSGGPGAGGVAR